MDAKAISPTHIHPQGQRECELCGPHSNHSVLSEWTLLQHTPQSSCLPQASIITTVLQCLNSNRIPVSMRPAPIVHRSLPQGEGLPYQPPTRLTARQPGHTKATGVRQRSGKEKRSANITHTHTQLYNINPSLFFYLCTEGNPGALCTYGKLNKNTKSSRVGAVTCLYCSVHWSSMEMETVPTTNIRGGRGFLASCIRQPSLKQHLIALQKPLNL